MSRVVVKIGGSILDSRDNLLSILGSIRKIKLNGTEKEVQLFIVVSALKGVTDKIISAMKNINKIRIEDFLYEMYDFHKKFLDNDDLSLKKEIFSLDNILKGCKMLKKVPEFAYDRVVSSGEFIVSKIANIIGMDFNIIYPRIF
ncbi:MAG: hypothetical protein ACP5KD_03850 [Fervidobacterium sp.]